MRRTRAFTLVEILIVVVLLGVLAAIMIPALAKSGASARQTTLAMNLNLLRRFIPVYQGQHLEVAPGYPDGDKKTLPTEEAFVNQALLSSNRKGETAPRGTLGYPFGPYLSKIPANPFNQRDTILVLANDEAFPAEADDDFGWIYRPVSSEIRPGNSGTDTMEIRFYDY